MNPKPRNHGLADFTLLESIHGFFKLWHKHAGVGPTQVPTLLGRSVLGKAARCCGKVSLATHDALAGVGQLGDRLGLRELRAAAQQDVPRMALDYGLHQAWRGAFLDDFEDVKTGARAHDLGHLTHLERLRGFHKKRGIPVGAAQAQLAPIVAVGCRRFFHQSVKVFTRTDAIKQTLSLHKNGCSLLGSRFFRHRDQNLGQVDVKGQRIGIGCQLDLHGTLHIDIRNLDGGLHLTFVQAVEHELVAQPVAEGGYGHAVFGQALVQAGHIHLVLGRHGLLRTVNRRGVNANTGFPGQLQLGAVADHALQHQAAQLGGGGHGLALLCDLLRDTFDFALQLLVRNGLGIHQRHDVVQRLAGLRVQRWQCQTAHTGKGSGPHA